MAGPLKEKSCEKNLSTTKLHCTAQENTWSHQRRKRRAYAKLSSKDKRTHNDGKFFDKLASVVTTYVR